MRRWSSLLTAFSLLAMFAVGCNHTAGVCDCDPWHDHGTPEMHGVEHSFANVPHPAGTVEAPPIMSTVPK